MPRFQTSVKPLVLAIALASSQVYGAPCTKDYTVSSQAELDSALNSIINSCGSADNPYTISLSDSLSGSSVIINGPIVLNTIELDISGPEAADVTLQLKETSLQAEASTASIRIVETGHLTLKDLILDGDSSSAADDYRVTALLNLESGQLDLENVALQNYYSRDDGAILSSGTTTIIDSTFQGITSDDPGSIISADSGSLIIEDSVFDDNHVGDSAGVIAVFESATLTITDSKFTNNSTDNHGGVLYAENSTVNIDGSTFSNNSSTMQTGRGGALSVNNTDLTVSNSVFENNNTSVNYSGLGGAIHVSASNGTDLAIEIDQSTFSDNQANDGGAIYIIGESLTGGELNITDTVFESNTASNGETGNGGALLINARESNGLTVTIDRSLFHDNDAHLNAGAIDFVDSSNSTDAFIIRNSTISNNTSKTSGGIRYSVGYGAGTTIANSTIINNTSTNENSGSALYANGVTASADIKITNTIISENTGPAGQVCGNEASHDFTYENSFVSNDDNSDFYCRDNTTDEESQVGTAAAALDPLLNSLADNGGFTKTYSPQVGSPVIDAGDVNFTSDGTDQRGVQRVINSHVDIGAVEFAGSVPALSQIDIIALSEMEMTKNTEVSINLGDYFSSIDGGDLTYAVTGLPTGLSVNSETGVVSGTVTESGMFSLNIRVENDYGLFLNKEVEVTVLAEPEAEETEPEAEETEEDTNSSNSSGGPMNPWFAVLLAMIAFVRIGKRTKS